MSWARIISSEHVRGAPMSAPRLFAQDYRDHGHAVPAGRVVLTYEDRFLRRKLLTLADGRNLLVDLPRTTSLDNGGVLICEDGSEIAVEAKPEPLLSVSGASLPRLAWHIGNRHTPCQIERERLLIQPDHVLKAMLARLGAVLCEVVEPFTPEGGAYGHGRTHAHEHGATAHDH